MMNMAKKRRSTKKRTISPEQLKKMQEGRERKRKHDERVKGLSDLETRLRKAVHER